MAGKSKGVPMNSPFRDVRPDISGDAERFLAGIAPIRPKVLQFSFWKIPVIILAAAIFFYLVWQGYLS